MEMLNATRRRSGSHEPVGPRVGPRLEKCGLTTGRDILPSHREALGASKQGTAQSVALAELESEGLRRPKLPPRHIEAAAATLDDYRARGSEGGTRPKAHT
ncbi:hypothetical protein NDU88_001050 [Pleurodeles waltl]|uniref:Uncharacterized protein n=1 Tax=Pleurodeles waltl TaxID=8319 RepID=A0AAV7RBI1_PLEWA|nr:hypothetical protein NDU88_001050 [Pleurodeles waltl]